MQAVQGYRNQKKVPISATSLLQKMKEHIFDNCYSLIKSIKISLPLAIFLLTIQEIQKFAIISRLSSNPDISQSPEMVYVAQISRYLLLDVTQATDSSRNILSIILTIVQLIITLCYIIPIKSQAPRQFFSKFMVTIFQYILVIPSILISADSISLGVNSYINATLLLLSLVNLVVYKSIQFECSFEREMSNVLVRVPRSINRQLVSISMIIMFPILNNTIYPTSFLIYVFINFGVITSQWWEYLKLFTYFQEYLSNLKGVLLSISISTHICYIAIHVFGNAIISQNVVLFISTFSIFLANFFVVFRNSIIKKTIIDQELKGEHETAIFAVFYWHCYKKIAIKKNQLYISSLLKKHTNQCVDIACCCKNRIQLFDANLKTFSNPKIQPHNDRIFIRHYIRRILMKGSEEHTKSIMLLFLLIVYDIEAIQMITHAMELIKKLSRMQQKKKLNFSQKFLLFCIKQKIKDKIITINLKRGNLDLQNVKKFDQKVLSLQAQLRISVKLYFSLWKHLNRLKFDQSGLYNVCKDALEVMFDTQRVYEQLKQINKQSSELKGIMLFYARMVVHDIHLLSQIRKQIKSSHFRNVIVGSLQQVTIKIFGTKTNTMISLQNGKIRWSSKNSHIIFEYPLHQFHSLNIKNLMPLYFAEKHDSYIQKWKETGHHIKLNKTSYSWGKNKDGSIFSMLMFVKLIPLIAEQDYAFFSCIQKLDDENEVICTQSGQLIGAGKLFPAALGVDAKNLQQIQPNIQVFMPYLFDYFLQYFFPKNKNLKNSKQNFEIRREGYFPQNLTQKMQQISYDRFLFKKNYIKKENFQLQYLSFVRQKMQQLTCNVKGNYISFNVKLYKTIEIFRENSSVLCLKVCNPKRDNVQRFYTELQKIINKLQHLSEELITKGLKTTNKKNKSDFFKTFLNPLKVKQIKQKESLKKSQDQELAQPDRNMITQSYGANTKKSAQNIVRHRKLLALGAQAEIKNERVKYNLWKIKKMLHEQRVISRYTYNLLIGKKENSVFQQVRTSSINFKDQHPKTTFQDPFQEQIASLDDQNSRYDDDGQGSQREMADKDNDNQTFNSASSSATFISMTNQVKMFKNELRSLNSPRPLFVLNILIITLVLGECFGVVFQMTRNNQNVNYGLLQFQLNTQANQLVSYLMQAQLNLQHRFGNITQAEPLLDLQKNYFINKTTQILQYQLKNRNTFKQYDESLLDFLNQIVNDGNSLKIRQFFQFILQQIKEQQFIFSFNYFIQTVSIISNTSQKTSFTPKIAKELLIVFIVYILLNFCFLISTFPIVYKIQVKIKQIYNLLSKISPNQKHKFYKHYRQLQEQFKKHQQINHQELSNLLANYQNKMKMFKYSQAISEQQRQAKSEADLKQSKKRQREAKSLSTDRSLYVKILAIYLILFGSVIFYYVFNNQSIVAYRRTRIAFSQVFNHKALLSQNFISCIYQIRGLKTKTGCNASNMDIVNSIYNTLQLPGLSQKYRTYTTHFINGTVCSNVTQLTYFTNNYNEKQIEGLCNTINHGTFTLGAINNLYYCQRKIESEYNKYAQSLGSNDAIQYLSSRQLFDLTQAYFFNTFFLDQLFQQIQMQVSKRAVSFKMSLSIGSYGCLALIVVFCVLWVYIFTRLGQSASYINAFLLLIPFDVLSENPYIKLYVKNQFDYKSSSY